MLAYAFWHWPGPSAQRYEERIGEFQTALGAHPPSGFRRGYTLAHPAAPWLPGPAYLDWYVVGAFADLQALSDGAVTGARKGPHDAVAAEVRSGAGGIYLHAGGSEELASAAVAQWFAKPRGVAYQRFLEPLVKLRGSLWLRQLALGPSPELVLFADAETALPVSSLVVPLRRVWPP